MTSTPQIPTLDYKIKGNNDKPTLVFIHGWPDDASLWNLQLPGWVFFYDDCGLYP